MSRNTTTELMGIALNVEGDTAPEWIQLIPAGPRISSRDGREWSMSDPQEIVSAFEQYRGDLPIDLEHATQVNGSRGEPAPAQGWIKELEARNGEIWGRVEWTDTGREAVASRAYRYLSPVFRYSRTSRAINRLVSAGLTNLPNLHLTALNREGEQKETQMTPEILEALGLKEGASDGDVLTAINRIKSDEATARNRAEAPDPSSFVPRADYDLALNKVRDFEAAEEKRAEAEIEAAVDAATEAGKIAPSSRDYHIAACRQEGGLERFTKMVDAAPEIAGKADLKGKPNSEATALNAEEQIVCDQMGISTEDFLAQKKEMEA